MEREKGVNQTAYLALTDSARLPSKLLNVAPVGRPGDTSHPVSPGHRAQSPEPRGPDKTDSPGKDSKPVITAQTPGDTGS